MNASSEASDLDVDDRHMRRALELAERGRYTTKPNPVVGCVVAHGRRIVGEGWHRKAGEPHAEVHALRQAGPNARGATAYVTLEPCSHHGRTPPCCEALIEAGVARVVVAHEDPSGKVDGRGVAALRRAGIEVTVGLHRAEAHELNVGFLANAARGRPWTRLKLGMSLDGRVALPDEPSQWITGELARSDVHRWRARSSAVVTGTGTIRADNPRLTVRLADIEEHVPPTRVVVGTPHASQHAAAVFDGGVPTIVAHTTPGSSLPPAVESLVLPAKDGRPDLTALTKALAERELHEILVEAGPKLSASFIENGLVDELLLYMSSSVLGDEGLPMACLPAPRTICSAPRFAFRDARVLGEDMLLRLTKTPRDLESRRH